MQHRYLGKEKLEVSAIGYGCPPFVGRFSEENEKKPLAVIHRAIDLGINFIDTADHNDGNNEEVLAKVLKGRRDSVVLTSKFGNLRGQPWAKDRLVNGRPEY
ncbi:MAG: aldo/keto reductase, partial [Candidatus Binatia bacterium]